VYLELEPLVAAESDARVDALGDEHGLGIGAEPDGVAVIVRERLDGVVIGEIPQQDGARVLDDLEGCMKRRYIGRSFAARPRVWEEYVGPLASQGAHLLIWVGEVEPQADGIVDAKAEVVVPGVVDGFPRGVVQRGEHKGGRGRHGMRLRLVVIVVVVHHRPLCG